MIFSTFDPLQRIVVLKKGTWYYKILTNRPELENYLPELNKLIQNPYYILRDMVEIEPGNKEPHNTREEYIDICQSKSSFGLVLLKAVVDHNTNPGEIVTAFTSSKLRGLTTEGGVIYVRC